MNKNLKKTKKYILFTSIILSFMLSGCKDTKTEYSKSGFAFDTVISITIYDNNKGHAESILEDCFNICEKYDDLFNISNESSDIYKINHSNGEPVKVSNETIDIINKSIYYSELTDGLFDITIEPIYELWDFDLKEHDTLPDASLIHDTLKYIDFNNITVNYSEATITVKSGTKINLGAIAKGYIADIIKEKILSSRISSAIINLGGNIIVIGKKPNNTLFNIGIQKPFSETGEIITSLEVSDKSVVTSGIYQRYFKYDNEIYHHIINSQTGYPIKNELSAVTIIADNSTDADALSTICMLLGYEKGSKLIESLDNVSAIFIDTNGNIL